jgi:hypothetical protein
MRVRIAAEGAVRENIFDNEEPSGGARRLAGRGAAARGTSPSCQCRLNTTRTVALFLPSYRINNYDTQHLHVRALNKY